jgi:uncharacterized protein YrrD
MEFKNGANIVTDDGKDAGILHRVVINPETNDITHIVIQKGLLFKDDKVIDVAKVASTSPEQVVLNCSAEDLKEMAPLVINQYVPLNGGATEEIYDLYGNPTSDRSVVMLRKRTIPEDLVALKEGARVTSEEGEHVGNIERVFTEPETGTVTHFMVSKGLLQKTRKYVPIDWVSFLDEDEVRLSVGTQMLDDLPLADI